MYYTRGLFRKLLKEFEDNPRATYKSVGDKFGYPKTHVNAIMNYFGFSYKKWRENLVKSMIEDGLSNKEVMKRTNCSIFYIQTIKKKYNLFLHKNKKFRIKKRDLISKLNHNYFSIKNTAKDLSIDINTLKNHIRKYKLEDYVKNNNKRFGSKIENCYKFFIQEIEPYKNVKFTSTFKKKFSKYLSEKKPQCKERTYLRYFSKLKTKG